VAVAQLKCQPLPFFPCMLLLNWSMQGKKSYQEKLFMQFSLSDHIPEDNFYRRLKSTLDFSYLYRSTSKYYGKEGQKSIDPIVFMKLMLVGYLENQVSDRRIIATSRMRLDILYFLGYDIDEELPWHSTLSRTRQLYGEDEFLILFKQVLKQCIDNGLVSGRRQAVDSVFVKANAAMSSMVERDILADAGIYAQELKAAEENMAGTPAVSKDEKIKNTQAVATVKATNKTHVSKSDPDAGMSVKPGKITKLNYLSQVSVDTASHVITNIQAFHADKGDSQCFKQVLDNTIKNLKKNGLTISEILADTAYSSGNVLEALAANNIEGYIPNPCGYRIEREGFIYEKEHDRYCCPQGAYLTLRRIRTDRGRPLKIYRSSVKDCRQCPLAKSCTGSTGIKSIEDSVSKALNDQMHQRMQSKKGRRMARLRGSTVEPVLGTLINFAGMKQVYTKGIKLANKCMIMASIAYNLKKLMKVMAHPRIKAPVLQQKSKQLLRFPFTSAKYSFIDSYTAQ